MAVVETPFYVGFMNHVLHFLSTASNEKLGACAAACGLVTYLVLGRFGLVIIGMVAGIVLHAAWEGYTGSGIDQRARDEEKKRRREVGLDVAARVLDWRQSQCGSHEDRSRGNIKGDALQALERQEDFVEFRAATRTALTRLVDAVMRDYVQ